MGELGFHISIVGIGIMIAGSIFAAADKIASAIREQKSTAPHDRKPK